MEFRSGRVAEENTVSGKGIRKKVKNSESVALKRIGNYDLLDLNKVLDDVYCSSRPISAEYETRKDLVKNLNAMALEIYGNCKESSPVLEAYGSFVMDMFSSQSDLDVSINFEQGTSELPRQKKIQILRTFAEKLQSLQGQGHVRNVKPILGARVPIVKFVDQGTDVICDLSVGNKDGILNSKIIHIISQIDDRFHKLCMLVKHWAKAHAVNSAPAGTLNSISITALVAHHLQTQDPPILPPLSVLFKDGTDPVNVEKRTQKFLKWGQRNKESLGRLFVTFFVKLQSIEFLWRQGLCVSSLSGLWISKKWKKSSINVEDFLDVSQNLARTVNGEGAKQIYGCINRTVEDLFEFLNGKFDGLHLRDILFSKQAVIPPPPPPPPSRLPLVLPFNFNTQEPHNDYRNEYNPEIRHNKRVCMVNGYKAVETDYIREEERYENLRKRYAGDYNGFGQFHDVSRFGVHHNRPLDDPYRHLVVPPWNGGGNGHLVHHRHGGRYGGEEPMPVGLWRDYGRRIDLPPPPPPGPPLPYGGEEPMPLGLWRDHGRRIDLPPPPPPPPLPYGRVNYENLGPPQPYFGRRSFYQ